MFCTRNAILVIARGALLNLPGFTMVLIANTTTWELDRTKHTSKVREDQTQTVLCDVP
jgi:hypothetical protein